MPWHIKKSTRRNIVVVALYQNLNLVFCKDKDKQNKKFITLDTGFEPGKSPIWRCPESNRDRNGFVVRKLTTTLRATITPHHRQ